MSAGNPLKIEYENAVKKFLDKNEKPSVTIVFNSGNHVTVPCNKIAMMTDGIRVRDHNIEEMENVAFAYIPFSSIQFWTVNEIVKNS